MVTRKTEKKGLKKQMRVTDITPQKEQSGKPIRLAAYCRVSSSSEDQLHSFATQIRYYRDYEKKHPEYKLVDIYADEGLSGICMAKRDELNRMLRDCQRGLIDKIITKSVSRLARNTEDILSMVRMLKRIGVSIYFEEQGLDSSTLNFEMFLTLPGMAAQQESITISQNLRWSYRKRMASGEFNTQSPPYGYRLIDGQLVIFEPEASVVRRIFNMYLQGIGKLRIAKTLNDEGIRSHSSKGYWYNGTIHYILTNERYMGDALLQKSFRTQDVPFIKVKNQGELPMYYVENTNIPIVDRETWNAVQKLLGGRTFKAQRYDTNDPLVKILKCSECGSVFANITNRQIKSWYNKCNCSEIRSCISKRVREDAVHNAFIRLIHKLKDHLQEIIEPTIKYLEIIQLLSNDNAAKISDIDEEIAKLSSQMLVITRLYNSGILTQPEYSTQSIVINNKISALRSERRKKTYEEDELLDDIRELRDLVSEADDQWSFSADLFRMIVVEIIVVSNAELRFRLIGGLEFTEYIEERERCAIK